MAAATAAAMAAAAATAMKDYVAELAAMKKLTKFRLVLCVMELAFCIVMFYLDRNVKREYQYMAIAEFVTFGGCAIYLTARLIGALMLEILPNDIDLVWTRTGMTLFCASAWVQVWERKNLDAAYVSFGGSFLFLIDQTVFFLNHPIPEEYRDSVQPRRGEPDYVEEKVPLKPVQSSCKPLLGEGQGEEEEGTCVRRTAVA